MFGTEDPLDTATDEGAASAKYVRQIRSHLTDAVLASLSFCWTTNILQPYVIPNPVPA